MPELLRTHEVERAATRRRRLSPRAVALWLLVALGAAAMLFPFVWTVVTSITPGANLGQSPTLWPQDPSFDAYRTLFERGGFGQAIVNSIALASATTVIQLITSSTAAYAFSRLPFRGSGAVFAVYLATMMIPLQVLIVPLFAQLKVLGLIDTLAGALLPSLASAFGIFLLRQAINQVPKELDEAATIDGAGHLRIFATIILPNIRAALATFAIFAFMGSWNSFLWPLVVLRSRESQTLPVALAGLQGQFTTQWDVVMAGSIVSIVPMLLIYLLAQRHVVQGVATSGLK
ncbi:carbohydrate ABC transporter permease [Agrococcus sp. Marseille-P2731]|uniref:carbohydrate ABC transporter permease n=1 Tax=Agrococcus sp. Marseille-P2731 TaxID=1841862 RepID=UPI0009F969A0|nr:carbohydrate ABC transporter permease [Agrococcus sp. Marseille-P2731]